MDDFPPIDELARRLTELGAFQASQWDEFKRLELSSLSSARKEDAMALFARLPESDPAKMAMSAGLADLRSWAKERVAAAGAGSPPRLVFVAGAPGSGKTALLTSVMASMPRGVVACADDFKERFKSQLPSLLGATTEPARSNLARSVYIHRLTALPSWEMVDEALEARRDLAVEMLGMGATEDERTIRRAIARGYDVEYLHVGCSVEVALARAAKRHFDHKAAGGEGRWIGLGAAAGKQRAILAAFVQICELLRGSPARLRLYDNTEMRMDLAWRSEDGGAPPIERFASWRHDPKLWRPGPNPAADLCALARGADGQWRVALVERAGEPHAGRWALPGGFVKGAGVDSAFEWGSEQARAAALRRFSEETLCSEDPSRVEFVGKFDGVERDPRNTESRWVESWVFCALFEEGTPILGGDAARSARWTPVGEVLSGAVDMAFDHAKLVELSVAALSAPAAARKAHRSGP